jgi:hypothetical protein
MPLGVVAPRSIEGVWIALAATISMGWCRPQRLSLVPILVGSDGTGMIQERLLAGTFWVALATEPISRSTS